MNPNTTRFDNGYELLVIPLPWEHCIGIAVKGLGGKFIADQEGPRGQILPSTWRAALEQEIQAGNIVDKDSMRSFYSRMSRE